ncbi:U4/U6 snRNA-associated-splicing factor, putative [Plasmodium knowlesi strain H]|uniref:U4/U6 snRNA-associated-splicing factor, putative n=3 Tax=Plasmodium knowlesi TaxID=5850 RepID=A0A5K1U196_PLAKH|nr:U4/U6 snRNA-associated-splicing factor, putative [Plasmodium knowlesi strain H]OTN67261.1 putative Rna-binding protein [Plasmodium knowlesi]CAA9987479.1 U4/U6 snRNA-associated-splicing factor, putative [Plasmodium knowlesi strain H]SBO23201.1 U4/U6 snRNA-associated-splicing factor, putative [Plasmodium knowlesi strain H]SBO23943.1 U4/U6 snRNA-associated-splicing factor, putative [Plasmodium knowlesi strain H]VVS76953.1 U4/U6 snRNA-associated-splicing factor, putative [Plasmodium knowlesi st|eukprot:XP_002258480.1 rna-binding protein, putative [Plasmodium knowlesi strain H]
MSDKELHIKRRKVAKEDGKSNDEPGVATSLDISEGEYLVSGDEGEESNISIAHSDDGVTHRDDSAEKGEGHVKHYLIEHMQDKSKLLKELGTLEENKLYVKNITDEVNKKDLINFFCKATGFVDTRVVRDSSGKSKSFAYVEFDTKENAANFFNTLEDSNVDKYKKFKIKEVDLYVAICKSTKVIYEEGKVFIKFSECQVDMDEVILKKGISDFLVMHSVVVEEIRLLGGSPPTHGYLQLRNNEDVVKCVETIKEGIVENVHFTLKYSIPIIKKKIIPDIEKIKANKEKSKKFQEEKKKEENNCTIVVKNLHFNTRKNKLIKLFEQIGEIDKINLSKKVSENNIKRNRGYAFITFKNSNDATSALILNDSIIDGRSILVSKFLGDDSRDKHRDGSSNLGGQFHRQHNTNRRGNYHHINYVKNNLHQERRRINLNNPDDPNVTVEKRTEQTEGEEPTPLTNDDFRKFFFK